MHDMTILASAAARFFLQAVAAHDTVIMRQVPPVRTWFEQVVFVASGMSTLLVLLLVTGLVVAMFAFGAACSARTRRSTGASRTSGAGWTTSTTCSARCTAKADDGRGSGRDGGRTASRGARRSCGDGAAPAQVQASEREAEEAWRRNRVPRRGRRRATPARRRRELDMRRVRVLRGSVLGALALARARCRPSRGHGRRARTSCSARRCCAARRCFRRRSRRCCARTRTTSSTGRSRPTRASPRSTRSSDGTAIRGPWGSRSSRRRADERVRAFGYGYLAHLAADAVAHNYFVPHQLARRRRARARSATATGRAGSRRTSATRFPGARTRSSCWITRRSDEHLDRILSPTIFSTPTNRRIFRGMVYVTDTRELAADLHADGGEQPLGPRGTRSGPLPRRARTTS